MRMHISKDIARLKLQEYDKDTLINYIIANSPVDFEKLDEIEKKMNEIKKSIVDKTKEKRDREIIEKMMEGENACIRNKQ
jgi:uncharacterized membrane protein (DUF106 family)